MKPPSGSVSRQIKLFRWGISLLSLLILTVVAFLLGMSAGELDISVWDVPRIMTEKEGVDYVVLTQIRLPRIILAIAAGGGLSLSGAVLQGIYRNPLVEPFTLGISGGAALGVALAIVFTLPAVLGAFALPLAGFAGALLAIVFVYVLGARFGQVNVNNMLLIGVMVSFVSSSLMMLMMSLATARSLHSIIFWMMGSLDEPNAMLIRLTLFVSVTSLVIAGFFSRSLNALRLGEANAWHLGVNTGLTIRVMFILASLVAGVCVASTGVIGFVGLVIPHLVRVLAGSDYRILLPASFLGGGIFLIICDAIARTIIAPNELPIGVITGIAGGIVFIVFLSRSKSTLKVN